MNPNTLQIVATVIFAIALVHTFSTKIFERLAQRHPAHAGIFHLLGEVEAVFGFWALVLIVTMAFLQGSGTAVEYVDTRNFTEPLFVFAIMVIAGTRPILQFCVMLARGVDRLIPLDGNVSFYFTVLAVLPLLGSFITEPAAMTLAALVLRDRFYRHDLSPKLMYATLGVLFVNVSIGGTLTSFAAPPVLMVAAKWNWDSAFMLTHIGWKAAVAVAINALAATLLFRRELEALPAADTTGLDQRVPPSLIALHLAFLGGVVVFAHHPAIFMGLFLFFLGVAHAYERHQDRLILREGLMVAFFLAGLIVLGGQQQWWLQPLLTSMSETAVYFGATALTAITDNAALTYLGSLVEGLSDEYKYALVTGAVTGGGLTVIANAPNPAGMAILRGRFRDETVHPFWLLVAATPPTLVAILAFRLL
ncbi:MAG: hypothetical protein K0S16_1537 [Moraxellaceae bacterium]|nr:hypothetical protein [Moraxellaceae bacterium]